MIQTAEITDARLAEIKAGLEGVTPGPWKAVSQPNFENGLVYTSIQPVAPDPDTMRPLLMAGGEHHICRMSHTAAMHKVALHRANAAHIARLDPDTVRAILARLKKAEAERDALLEALTPSGDTKAAYIGEFEFPREQWNVEGDDTETVQVTVPWTTTKEIMAAIRARALLSKHEAPAPTKGTDE